MLDLNRHINCPTWELQSDDNVMPWSGLKYACLKVLYAYCKVFDQQEICDLIVRYGYIQKIFVNFIFYFYIILVFKVLVFFCGWISIFWKITLFVQELIFHLIRMKMIRYHWSCRNDAKILFFWFLFFPLFDFSTVK